MAVCGITKPGLAPGFLLLFYSFSYNIHFIHNDYDSMASVLSLPYRTKMAEAGAGGSLSWKAVKRYAPVV